MKKVFAVFVLLIFFCACKPNKADETEIAWDTTRYELYDELLFGRFYHTARVFVFNWLEEQNAQEPIIETDMVFGLIDVFPLKSHVITMMKQTDMRNRDEYSEKVIRPILDAAKEADAKIPDKAESRAALVYYIMFRPQIKYQGVTDEPKEIVDEAQHAALTRVNFKYWYPKIRKCLDEEIRKKEAAGQEVDVLPILEDCSTEYSAAVSEEVEKIISQIKQDNDIQ